MGTLAELKARIAGDIDREDMDSTIALHIERAIEHFASRRFWFNEGTATAQTTAGSASVSLDTSTAPRIEDKVSVTVGGSRYDLIKRPFNDIDAWLGSSSCSGQPTDYAVQGEQYWLYPVPGDTYTLTTAGIFNVLPALDDDAASNAWTTEAQDLIAARARYTINRDILRDFEAAKADQVAEAEALKALRRETALRVGTGRMAAHS